VKISCNYATTRCENTIVRRFGIERSQNTNFFLLLFCYKRRAIVSKSDGNPITFLKSLVSK